VGAPPIHELDETIAREVADAFLATPSDPADPRVRLSYAALESETDTMFARLTDGRAPGAYRVVFTDCPTPYTSDVEMIEAVRATRLLEVVANASDRDRPHRVLGCDRGGAYDRFRAVHDLVGHVRYGLGFDRQGEFATWQVQEPMYSAPARLALATELHAEHSVLWTTGTFAEHTGILLDRRLVARARRGTGRLLPLSASAAPGFVSRPAWSERATA
jgi:hypothetical protein